MKNNLRIVLDTNILISALSLTSPYRALIDYFLDGRYDLVVSTEILLEYEEKLKEKYDASTAVLFLDALSIAPNVYKIEPFFHLHLIYPDMDDNKFVDCAFGANAHALVTNDRDFRVLEKIDFPKINLLSLNAFLEMLTQLSE
ncbi:MAG: hypothetical protein KIPDCIKN_02725 [Haliscomenobacter sp.]|jgi:putative PIN family toxin of toxin-antitoxin system|nr:hypothetical protein [Haliscomenobacter sp.]